MEDESSLPEIRISIKHLYDRIQSIIECREMQPRIGDSDCYPKDANDSIVEGV